MDNTDLKILKLLQENARITMKELGERVGLSSPAVTERVKRLEEDAVITGYHAEVDYEKFGKMMTAVILILVNERDIEAFMDYCQKKEEILQVDRILYAGANMFVHVRTENSQTLEKILIEIHRFGPTTTAIHLSTYFKSKEIL